MSMRGRGRSSVVPPNDRSLSSSSTDSSRSSSLTRPTSSLSIHDADRLMKQLKSQQGVGSTATTGLGTGVRPTPRITPNLAVSRKIKDKTDAADSNSVVIPSDDRSSAHNNRDAANTNRFQRGGARGTGRRGNASGNYIQTDGIFGGDAQIPVAASTSLSGSRLTSIKSESATSSSKISSVKKPGVSKTTLIGDVDGLKYEIDEENEPRLIPLTQRKSVFGAKKGVDFIKKSMESASTVSEHVDSFVHLFSQQKPDSSTKSIIKDEPMESITDTIPKPSPSESMPDSSQLILMQFPDVLPCTRTTTSSSKPELVSLSDLPDGFLGKLQIFRSGKCRLKLNEDTYLDVDIAQPTSFLQNVMVTEMAATQTMNDEHENNSDMNKLVCLGDIKHKLIVSLDAEHVLHDSRQ